MPTSTPAYSARECWRRQRQALVAALAARLPSALPVRRSRAYAPHFARIGAVPSCRSAVRRAGKPRIIRSNSASNPRSKHACAAQCQAPAEEFRASMRKLELGRGRPCRRQAIPTNSTASRRLLPAEDRTVCRTGLAGRLCTETGRDYLTDWRPPIATRAFAAGHACAGDAGHRRTCGDRRAVAQGCHVLCQFITIGQGQSGMRARVRRCST